MATGGTPPYKYQINSILPLQNNGYFPGLDQGNYFLQVTDALGNTYNTNVFLSYTLPQPMLELNVLQLPTSCTNADGSVQLTGIAGTPPYSYSWDGGLTFSPAAPTTMSNLQEGYYWNFEVKDANGCIASVETNDARGTGNYFMCFACCNLEVDGIIDSVPCANNGQLTVDILDAGPGPFYYSLDGINYQLANGTNQNVNTFSNLAPGVYHVYAKEQCSSSVEPA